MSTIDAGRIAQIELDYKSNPSDKTFIQLVNYAATHEEYSLSSYLLANHTVSMWRTKHLAEAFAIEGRYLEAHYFCTLWQKVYPTSISSWRLAALIAAHRCDRDGLQLSRKRLHELNAPQNIQWMALTLESLVFYNAYMANDYAANMLLTGEPDVVFFDIALDVAFRNKFADLLLTTIIKMNKTPKLASNREKQARILLLGKLVSILNERTIAMGVR